MSPVIAQDGNFRITCEVLQKHFLRMQWLYTHTLDTLIRYLDDAIIFASCEIVTVREYIEDRIPNSYFRIMDVTYKKINEISL